MINNLQFHFLWNSDRISVGCSFLKKKRIWAKWAGYHSVLLAMLTSDTEVWMDICQIHKGEVPNKSSTFYTPSRLIILYSTKMSCRQDFPSCIPLFFSSKQNDESSYKLGLYIYNLGRYIRDVYMYVGYNRGRYVAPDGDH